MKMPMKILPNSQWKPSPTMAPGIQPTYGMPLMAAGMSAGSMKPSNRLHQPPKKNTAVSAATRIMFAYSARKNSANAMPEYSTWKPATISDSPSATSNGARLVSATPEMKYTTNSGNSQDQFQANHPPCCPRTMSPRFKLPAAMITPTSAKPMAIS